MVIDVPADSEAPLASGSISRRVGREDVYKPLKVGCHIRMFLHEVRETYLPGLLLARAYLLRLLRGCTLKRCACGLQATINDCSLRPIFSTEDPREAVLD
ncbi:hypothetical protein ACWCHM_21735 [Micromonospora sp. SCSIO 07396]